MPQGFALTRAIEAMHLMQGLGSHMPTPVTPNGGHNWLQPVQIYGKNTNISSLVDIWGMNIVKTFPASSFTLAVVSDSANDTGAGTGAQTVGVKFLDANWIAHYATYTLNGQTAVTAPTTVDGVANSTPQTAIRVNGFEVLTVGTGLANAGNIYAYDSSSAAPAGVPATTSKVFDYCIIGDNVSSPGSFSVPANRRFCLQSAIPSFDDATTTVKYGSVSYAQTLTQGGPFQKFLLGQLTSQSGTNLIEFEQYPIVEGGCDIKFMGQASAAAAMSVLATGMMW